jgi:hypothetical protein
VLLGSRTEALDFHPSAPKAGRRVVAKALVSWGLDRHVGVAQLCTTELVTEALRHGRSPLHLVVQRWTDCVHVTVIDGAKNHDETRDLGPYSESWTRQRIVEGLVGSWGVEPVPAGTAAWFDVDTQPTWSPPSMSCQR